MKMFLVLFGIFLVSFGGCLTTINTTAAVIIGFCGGVMVGVGAFLENKF